METTVNVNVPSATGMKLTVVPYVAEKNPNYVQGYGKLFTQGANKEFFTCRVESKQYVFQKGIVVEQKRQARLTLPVELMSSVKSGANINTLLGGLGMEPFRIVVQESREPFYDGQTPKLAPQAHETNPGDLILIDGEPLYYQTSCVPWSSEEHDVRITGEMTFESYTGNDDDAEDLDAMSIDELKALATERNIKFKPNATAAALKALIAAAS